MNGIAPRVWAEALGAELERRGFHAYRLTTADHDRHPCIVVQSAQAAHRAAPAYIYTAPDDEGSLWYWAESMEPISPVFYIAVAADIITAQMSLQRLRLYPVRAV